MKRTNDRGFTPSPIFTNTVSWFLSFTLRSRPRRQAVIQKKLVGGFTLIEILITVMIIGLLTATIIPSLLNFRRNSLLNTETQQVVTLINRARILAVSSKNDAQFGVHLETGKVVLFQGATYTAGLSTNEEHIIATGLTLSSISINGGGSEILFEKVTGSTTKNATTTLLVSGTTSSSTILILNSGIVTLY